MPAKFNLVLDNFEFTGSSLFAYHNTDTKVGDRQPDIRKKLYNHINEMTNSHLHGRFLSQA